MEALLRGAARFTPGAVADWEGPPAQTALATLLATADAELGRFLARTAAPVLPSARRDLVTLLSKRLMRSCLKVLALEREGMEALRLGGKLDSSAHAWRERFLAYPVLAELMGTAFLHWRLYVREMLSRLAADRAALGKALWSGRPPGALARVDGDVGDLHAGGRAVAVLRFEDGRRTVYKPKDLRITRAVHELYTVLNDSGLPLPLHVYGVLCRRGYAWEEYVEAAPCRTSSGVERFYVRMGMLARLMQLLEAQDLWLENLVAHGEHPVLVDVEMVLQPRMHRRATRTAERAAEDFLSESVAPLGLLAAPLAIAPGVPAEDLGGLAPQRPFLIPLRCDPRRDGLEGTPQTCRDGYVLKTHTGHAPAWAGRQGKAEEHFEALLEGYRAMHATLRASRSRLRAKADSPRGLARLPVRYVHRDTWECYRILDQLMEPRVLASTAAHQATQARLLRVMEGRPSALSGQEVVRRELEVLRALEVPYFTSLPGSRELLGPRGERIRSRFFEGTALERLRRRLRELDSFPLARHEAVVRSMIATGSHEPVPLARPRLRPESGVPDWLSEAVSIGDILLREAFSARGGISWIGLRYEPLYELWHLGVPGPDLLGGTAGVAIALAELAAASGLSRFRSAALAALASTRVALQHARRGRWEHAPDGTPEVGAFRGIGALLYALHRCATALGLPEIASEALDHARMLPVARLAAQASLDLATGAPGLLLALRACGATKPARRLTEALSVRLERGSEPVPASVPKGLQGLPDAGSALALCGLRASLPTGGTSTGSLLARIALARGEDNPSRHLLPDIRRQLRRVNTGSEYLEALELALTARRALNEPEFLHEAVRSGRTLVAGHRLHGRWFPERIEAAEHDLSAIDGLCALLRAFLGLHRPEGWTSLRLVMPAAMEVQARTRSMT